MRPRRPRAAGFALLGLALGLVSCKQPEPVAPGRPPRPAAPARATAPVAPDARSAEDPAPPAESLPDFEALFATASPAVVNISAAHALPIPADLVPRRERAYWRALARSLGSGFALDDEGHVVTCSSVIQDAEEIEVLLADGRRLPAKLVAADPLTDLAVLQVPTEHAPPPLPIAARGALSPGDWVAAFGYPFGLTHSITAGIVSTIRTGRQLEASHGLILSDAAINPGCNGGPLVSATGQVVGINQIPAQVGGGLGVAVPIHDALPVIEKLKAGSLPNRPWLGISIQHVDAALADAFGLEQAEGALITRVEAKGPAAEAGLQVGDVITDLAGRPVEDPQALIETAHQLAIGRAVQIRLVRAGKPIRRSITPGSTPP